MRISNRYASVVCTLAMAVGLPLMAGCSETQNSASSFTSAPSMAADPSLFEPATNELYTLRGEIVGAKVQSHNGIPLEKVPAQASGYIVLSDGVLSEAEIVAVIDSVHHLKFELTEPAVFERQGQLSDLIHGIGKLTTDSGTFNDTRVLLAPRKTATGTTVDATIDIPNFIAISQSEDSLQLALKLEKPH